MSDDGEGLDVVSSKRERIVERLHRLLGNLDVLVVLGFGVHIEAVRYRNDCGVEHAEHCSSLSEHVQQIVEGKCALEGILSELARLVE